MCKKTREETPPPKYSAYEAEILHKRGFKVFFRSWLISK